MARYVDSACRLCRRENLKMMLKGDRCFSDKCALERRPYPPGMHGQSRKKITDYGIQLREKQKVKRMYGMLERQFRVFYARAAAMKGNTGENLLLMLERRMDNMVYRMGFAATRSEARQLVRHGHFRVNGRKTTIPSLLIKAGDVVTLRERSKKNAKLAANLESAERRGFPGWLEVNREAMQATVKAYPARDEITIPIQEQLIVELYSK
ncbi:MAG: 30S ribosomal protein S4 [Deltaproteobacteria bacterium]|nr:30S ribosomal protein S4 [Deltaproteobacteria bacterium]